MSQTITCGMCNTQYTPGKDDCKCVVANPSLPPRYSIPITPTPANAVKLWRSWAIEILDGKNSALPDSKLRSLVRDKLSEAIRSGFDW